MQTDTRGPGILRHVHRVAVFPRQAVRRRLPPRGTDLRLLARLARAGYFLEKALGEALKAQEDARAIPVKRRIALAAHWKLSLEGKEKLAGVVRFALEKLHVSLRDPARAA